MRHLGTITLNTPRLTLRRFMMTDALAMYKNWASSNSVTKYLRWLPHQSEEESRGFIADWIEEYKRNDFYHWAIVVDDIDEPIGSISVVDMDENDGMVHIGYCIGEKWWNMGYTSEALACIMRFFFDEVGATRVESQHDPANPASGRVMVKCGMHYERTIPRGDVNNQGIVDAVMYSISLDEYRKMGIDNRQS